jgi:hypothetical protein
LEHGLIMRGVTTADQEPDQREPSEPHGVVAPLPQLMLTLDDGDDAGTLTITGGGGGGPVVVVVVVVVPLASRFISVAHALVTEGVPALHVGQDPPETVALPPSPPQALASAPSATTSPRRQCRIRPP